MMATHPQELTNPAELLDRHRNKMRAFRVVTVTISMDVFAPVTAPVTRPAWWSAAYGGGR